MRNEMSRGEVVVYQGRAKGFDELLTEGTALLDPDLQQEGDVDLGLVEAESEMFDSGSAEEEGVDSDLVEAGRQILDPGN